MPGPHAWASVVVPPASSRHRQGHPCMERMMAMVEKKKWADLKQAGLLWWTNRILHTFGWSIVVEVGDDGTVGDVYPARTNWLGFPADADEAGLAAFQSEVGQSMAEGWTPSATQPTTTDCHRPGPETRREHVAETLMALVLGWVGDMPPRACLGLVENILLWHGGRMAEALPVDITPAPPVGEGWIPFTVAEPPEHVTFNLWPSKEDIEFEWHQGTHWRPMEPPVERLVRRPQSPRHRGAPPYELAAERYRDEPFVRVSIACWLDPDQTFGDWEPVKKCYSTRLDLSEALDDVQADMETTAEVPHVCGANDALRGGDCPTHGPKPEPSFAEIDRLSAGVSRELVALVQNLGRQIGALRDQVRVLAAQSDAVVSSDAPEDTDAPGEK